MNCGYGKIGTIRCCYGSHKQTRAACGWQGFYYYEPGLGGHPSVDIRK